MSGDERTGSPKPDRRRRKGRGRRAGPRVGRGPRSAHASVTNRGRGLAACAPGLEPLLAKELAGLGVADVAIEPGGVAFGSAELPDWTGAAGHELCLRANLELGLATHVLVRLAEFPCRSLGELLRKTAQQVDWKSVLFADRPLEIRVHARRSRLFHTGAIAERVRKGIGQSLGGQPPESQPPEPQRPGDDAAPESELAAAGSPPAVVRVRLLHDVCTLSLDTSGEPLYRRGYRLATGKAPLRPDLARAFLRVAGYDPDVPLLDPFCGSGTILIEAAMLARRLAPGRLRSFGLEGTRWWNPQRADEVRSRAFSGALESVPAPIVGSDRDAGVVEHARANAQRAGVAADVEIERAALRNARWLSGEDRPEVGQLVTNPPFGARVGNVRDLRDLYDALGRTLAPLTGWRLGMLGDDRRLATRTGISWSTGALVDHGGRKVRMMVCQAPGGT